MSEGQARSDAAAPAPSAGALLRAARENLGLPVEELAALLKVTSRRVELLEADRFDQLPDPVFVRALAQTMCRTLKIDPAPVLALLPQTPSRQLDQFSVGLNAPFHQGPAQVAPDNWGRLALPFIGAGGLLVAATLLVYFFPVSWETTAKVSPRPVPAASAPAVPGSAATPSDAVVAHT
ncbi:MAG: helix-turn-helix domain-containing protein, partial [Burkholderiaceae bacterium]